MPRSFPKNSWCRLVSRSRCGRIVAWCGAFLATGTMVSCTIQPVATALPAVSARVAFQSPCAQNAIECTSSWPTAVASVEAIEGQTVTPTAAGFLIEAPSNTSGIPVQFVGDGSTLGNGATVLTYSWTSNATEDAPCVLTPGEAFATTARPIARLAPGFHYIRLTVENDIIRDSVESDACGVFGTDIPSFDFIEVEVEVRN